MGQHEWLLNKVHNGKEPNEKESKCSLEIENYSLASYKNGRALTALCPNQNKFFEDLPRGARYDPHGFYNETSSYDPEED